MVWQLKRKRPRRRYASSLAIMGVALLALTDFTVLAATNSIRTPSEATDDISSTQQIFEDNNNNRRLRADLLATRVENQSNKVTLLVKYKDNTGHRRSTETYNNRTLVDELQMDVWQAHTLSIETISINRYIDAVEIDTDVEDIELMKREIMEDGDVELVEEDYPMYKMPTEIEEIFDLHRQLEEGNNRKLAENVQYWISMTQVNRVWERVRSRPNKYRSSRVGVCIVDTGYDLNHEDLPKGAVSAGSSFGSALSDGDGHGTHCAGVVGAIGGNGRGVVGVNPDEVKFRISKALNNEGMGTASSVIKGIDDCMNSGAKVMSMSLGGGPNADLMDGMFDEAYDQGMMIFGASGNLGIKTDDYPASYPHVISIGAVDRSGRRADFSNWSEQLELLAPGKSITSTYPSNRYATLSGTSMATPIVAGIAAMIWSYFPQCSNQQIRNVLLSSAKTLTDNPTVDCNQRTGWGMVQALDAFDLLEEYGCAAGGQNYNPPRRGGVGGCNQPLADISSLVPLSQQVQPPPINIEQSNFDCKRLMLKIMTDSYAYENSWVFNQITNGNTRVELGKGPPGEGNYADLTEYNGAAHSGCLEAGTYEFIFKDLFGDGMCPGYYEIKIDGTRLKKECSLKNKSTTRFTINQSGIASVVPDIVQAVQVVWRNMQTESFTTGMGKFSDGGANVVYIPSKYNRNGLVMIKSGYTNHGQAAITSQRIQNRNGLTKFQIVLNFFANGAMSADGKFCVEYKVNGATSWTRAKCWKRDREFEAGVWVDNASIDISPESALVNNIMFRIHGRSQSNMDRFFFDSITLRGRKD